MLPRNSLISLSRLASSPVAPALTLLSLTDSSVEIVAEQCHKLSRIELYWDVVLTDIVRRTAMQRTRLQATC